MEKRSLSKLQIRAELVKMLNDLASFGDDIPFSIQNKYLTKIKSIENAEDVVDILIKDLPKADYSTAKVITFFLLQIGSLDMLNDRLWEYLKSDISDEIKDLISVTLRELGDKTDPDEYMNYLEDPSQIVDKETEKLLETAMVNPEAQIDFLDFLFAMPENEQLNLVNSLNDDYSGESLANILIPALESLPSPKVQELIIETLGSTKAQVAVQPLLDIEKYSPNIKFKKLARKSLNMLKLSGIDSAKTQSLSLNGLCKISKIYECYSSMVDGMGNQGLIISRQKDNDDIIMFSVVINDNEGIIDCFGFYGISKDDLYRIIIRFEGDSKAVLVSAEYCKNRLIEAESINKNLNKNIPYEYTAWKAVLGDTKTLDTDIADVSAKWVQRGLEKDGDLIYMHPDFKHWFFEESENSYVDKLLENALDYLLSGNAKYTDVQPLINYLEGEITKAIPDIFDQKCCKYYANRLFNTAYLLNDQGIDELRDITATIGKSLLNKSDYDLPASPFIRQLLRKTILEKFLRYQESVTPPANAQPISTVFARSKNIIADKSPKIDVRDIIIKLSEIWKNNTYDV